MLAAADHTREVERRVAAFYIKATDVCGFFRARAGIALTAISGATPTNPISRGFANSVHKGE